MKDAAVPFGRDVIEFAKELVSPTAVLFTHLDHETGEITNICVSSMLKDPAVQAHAATHVQIDDEFASFCLTNRGIENHRLARLMHVARPDPILIVEWGDGTHVIVDGNHRYVAASIRGHKLIRAKVLPPQLWHRHVVLNIPDHLSRGRLTGFSGIA